MAYESGYTGPQVDEGVRRALTIPSTGFPSEKFPYYLDAKIEDPGEGDDKEFTIGFYSPAEYVIQRYLNQQQVIAQLAGNDGYYYKGQLMLMGYDSNYAMLTWMGTIINYSTTTANLYLVTCSGVGGVDYFQGTAKAIPLPSEAFGTLAFKSLVAKTDLSTEVLTLLNKQPKQYTGTLLASGWAADSHGYQAQTITITGLKASYDIDPQWDVALSGTDPDADAALLEGFALIHNYTTGANSLTAQCIGAAPTVNIPVKVVIFG